jgi:hypothetical protein
MDGDWWHRREEVTYEEARTVLDRQQQLIADIDEKAVQTVRITTVLLGVIVTGAEVSNTTIFHDEFLIAGGASLFLSIIAGMWTYSESDLYIGPNKDYVRQLAKGSFYGTEWDDDLLMTMADWIEANHGDITFNGRLLSLTQILLALGVLLVALAVVF